MLKINLTEKQLKELYEFLSRTELKGFEVLIYNWIMQILWEASEDKTEELENKIKELEKPKGEKKITEKLKDKNKS